MSYAQKRRRKVRAAAEERQQRYREEIPSVDDLEASISKNYPHITDPRECAVVLHDFYVKWWSGPAFYDGR